MKTLLFLLSATLFLNAQCLDEPNEVAVGSCYELEGENNLAQAAYERALLEDEDNLKDNQFRFRPGGSNVDAIFILHGIISNILQNKLKLYSAFVDFRKAFDKLNRRILIYSYYVMDLVLNL